MLAHGLINTGKKKPINGIEHHKPYMGITSYPLPQNNGNLPLPFFSGNHPIVLLDSIYEMITHVY